MADRRLRFGLGELLLVQPGATAFRPPPEPDAPGVQLALELAARPESDAHGKAIWEQGQPARAAWAAAHVYALARRPDTLWAPPPWPQELALLGAEVVAAALADGPVNLRAVALKGPPYAATAFVLHRIRRQAERRQARRLRLTPLTSPQPDLGLPRLLLPVFVAYWLLRMLRVLPRSGRPPWSLSGATVAIRQLNRRRTWQRAYAAAARSAQARSSACSSTSAGWAPETP